MTIEPASSGRTDLRTLDGHEGYEGVYALLKCDVSIKPVDSVSSDPKDAAARQTAKLRDGRPS